MKISLYVSDEQKRTWDDARKVAKAAGTSLSQLATAALDAHLAQSQSQTARQRRTNEFLRKLLHEMADEIDASLPPQPKKKGKRS